MICAGENTSRDTSEEPQEPCNIAEEYCQVSFPQICLRKHFTRKLLGQCWSKVHRYTFAGKPAFSNMSGDLFLPLKNLGSFCSLLAQEFIYNLLDNNKQGLKLTGTICSF